jgi:outer membrane protein, multidrug efflux system
MRPRQIICHRRVPLGLPLLLALIVLTGCTVGPDYRRPDIVPVMQDNWQAQGGQQFTQGQPLTAWWQQFHDKQLTDLVKRLISSSLALKEARQRVAEVNARYGVIGADRQLQLAAALDYTHAETGDETVSLQRIPPGESINIYSAGITAGWELDLWGKTTRRLEAAEADIKAGYTDYEAMRVSLAAEMTLAYIDARTLAARLTTIGTNIDLQQETLKLAQSRYQAGNGTALSVVRTQRLLESTRARVPELERALSVAKNRIKVLLGVPPRAHVLEPGPMPAVPEMIGLGLPADLLTRRPDIRQAFHHFHAAVARIGAAEAERYPSLSLSGTLTLSSDALDGLLDMDTLMYSLGPGIHIPIFTGHRIESTIAVRSAQAEQARLAIEQKIVAALAEVENAAQGVIRSQQRADSLAGAEKLAIKSVDLSDSLYRSGLVGFSEVLDNEQELVALQESLLLARQQALSEVVRLYRALGGGWEPTEASLENNSEDNLMSHGEPL